MWRGLFRLQMLLTGPVHIHVSLGLRDFTRADAQRITDAVLAGLDATARQGPFGPRPT